MPSATSSYTTDVPLFSTLKIVFTDVVAAVMFTLVSNCIIPSNFVTPLHSDAEESLAIKLSDESNK